MLLFPNFISLAPSVRKTSFIRICVLKPKAFKAYAPVGTNLILSLFAIPLATSSADGSISPMYSLTLGRT
ncbi:MAG: hypothetical protein IPF54_21700 [Draconibacterium sp.]|nr:hypothetical protein [Draconibacterium sp.]